MIKSKLNNRRLFFIGVFLIIIALLFFYFNLNPFSNTSKEVNPFIKEMPLKYSNLVEKAKTIKGGYSGIIYENGINNELLIFKEFPSIDEQETDFTITLNYTTNTQSEEEQNLELENTNKAILYNFNNKAYGVFIKELPQVNIKEAEVVLHKYRTARIDWKTTFKSLNTQHIENLVYKSKDYSSYSLPNAYRYHYNRLLELKDIKYLPYTYTIKNDSLYQITKELSKYIEENNSTMVFIKDTDLFWKAINENDPFLLTDLNIIGENIEIDIIEEKVELLTNNKVSLNKILDIHKLSNYLAITSLFSSGCKEELILIYNKKTKLLEPFFTKSICLGERAKIVRAPKLTASDFLNTYIRTIDSITSNSILETNTKRYQKELALINSYYPNKIYNYNTLLVNRNLLKNNLYPPTFISASFISLTKENLKLSIQNVSYFPINIKGLNYKSNKKITRLSPVEKINKGEKKEINIPLPRSFENLFVHKKTKTTGFILSKDIYDLRVLFSVEGLDTIQKSSILPYQAIEVVENDLFRQKPDIENRKQLKVDQKKKEITFLDSVTINSPLIIPSGFVLKAEAGTKINIMEGGKIVSNSPLNFIGTKENPIEIFSSDKKGQGMIVLAEDKSSYLKHVSISHLSNPSHGYWMVTGALTFYESPVKLEYVTITDNRSEDALNIVRTNFLISHCTISNTQSDAFDGDFVEGIVKDSYFTNLGNDAIDISGSDISIVNVTINEAGDKGLSAGENSKMKINNVTIKKSAIGVAGKDLSRVEGKELTIIDNKLAFTAFKKKPEFGPSQIILTEVKLEAVETIYLIEDKSSLVYNGEIAKTVANVKGKMYGVEFGKSSKETNK